jgi:hypothetical protein
MIQIIMNIKYFIIVVIILLLFMSVFKKKSKSKSQIVCQYGSVNESHAQHEVSVYNPCL